MSKQTKEETWNPDRVVKALQNLLMHPGLRTAFENCPVLKEARAALAEVPVFKYPLKRWTVLLLMPDYLAENFGQDTYCTHVQAETAARAIQIAKEEAIEARQVADVPAEDWYVLAIFEGFQFDVNPQPYLT